MDPPLLYSPREPRLLRKSRRVRRGRWGTLLATARALLSPNDAPLTEERFDVVPGLRREWMIVVRRRRLVALGLVSALVGATIYNYTLRPVYEGLSVVALAEAMAANPLARMSTEVTRLGAILERQRALIRSPEFASRLVGSLDPAAQMELSLGPIGTWVERVKAEWGRLTGAEGRDTPVDSVAAFRSRLRVTGEAKSTWIEIRFAAHDPKVAADIANAIMDQYLRETDASNRRAVEQT